MLTILINASITWLCSLLVYEFLLKKETFHRLNRFYLLFTFSAGIILAILPWEPQVHATILRAGERIAPAVPSSLHPATLSDQSAVPHADINWWLLLYTAGATIGILYLIRDLIRLRLLYKRATLQRDGRWIIATTAKVHSPFSFLHIIFVSGREHYTEQQWQMILAHEQQHYHSRHILDMVLMQLAMILLWFHPLVYIYRYKLRLLHEYEVDSMQQEDVQTYGYFLLEQAALKPPPVMTHSFSFSPLKNRIYMMTRNTSKRNVQYRLFLLIPMMSCFIWCCTQSGPQVAIDIKDRYAMRHDINLEYTKASAPDTLTIDTPGGQTGMTIVVHNTYPVKLNHQDILQPEDLSTPPKCTDPGAEFGIRYLIKETGLEKILQKMADGDYFMSVSDIIVDPSGHIVYYMITFPENWGALTADAHGFNYAKPSGLTDKDEAEIQQKISAALMNGSVTFTAGKNAQGDKVPYFLEPANRDIPSSKMCTNIIVRDHKISYKK